MVWGGLVIVLGLVFEWFGNAPACVCFSVGRMSALQRGQSIDLTGGWSNAEPMTPSRQQSQNTCLHDMVVGSPLDPTSCWHIEHISMDVSLFIFAC